MKVIVAYLVHPYDEKAPAVDSRPKSIERITTSAKELQSYLYNLHFDDELGFKPCVLYGRTLHCISDRVESWEKKYRIPDVFEYLEKKLQNDEVCANVYARIYGRLGEYYYGFQVRNLH